MEFLGQGVNPHRKAGWIVRSSLDADAPYASALVHGDGLTSLQFRKARGAITEQIESAARGADVIQLERKGNSLHLLRGPLRRPVHRRAGCPTSPLGDAVYVGLFLCSHNPEVVETAVFRDVRIIRPARDGFVPYRDYIGSHLELLDLETGHRQIVLQLGRALRGAQLDARRRRRSSTTPAAARRATAAGCTASTWPRADPRSSTPASPSATTTTTCCRSTARCSASATTAPDDGPVDDLHPAGGRRDAEAHHAA